MLACCGWIALWIRHAADLRMDGRPDKSELVSRTLLVHTLVLDEMASDGRWLELLKCE